MALEGPAQPNQFLPFACQPRGHPGAVWDFDTAAGSTTRVSSSQESKGRKSGALTQPMHCLEFCIMADLESANTGKDLMPLQL